MSQLGAAADPRDTALLTVGITLVSEKTAGVIAFSQTVPGRPYGTPTEEITLQPREPVEFVVRFWPPAVTATFTIALTGWQDRQHMLSFHVAPRSPSGDWQEIDGGRFDLLGPGPIHDQHEIVELVYDGAIARWRAWVPRPPSADPRLLRQPNAEPSDAQESRDTADRLEREALDRLRAAQAESRTARRLASRRNIAERVREWGEPTPGRSLHDAAEESDAATVRYILDHGGDVHVRSPDGATPLHVAVRSPGFVWMHTPRQLDVVEQLLAAGADPNARDARGATPLHRALDDLHHNVTANLDVVEVLLEHGADPNARTIDGYRPSDKPPYVHGHMSPTWNDDDLTDELTRRAVVSQYVFDLLNAARRGKLP